MNKVPDLSVRTGTRAWDTIWKWTWFAREQWQSEFRTWKKDTRLALGSLLPKLGVKSVLDCSCGLGFKRLARAPTTFDLSGSPNTPCWSGFISGKMSLGLAAASLRLRKTAGIGSA